MDCCRAVRYSCAGPCGYPRQSPIWGTNFALKALRVNYAARLFLDHGLGPGLNTGLESSVNARGCHFLDQASRSISEASVTVPDFFFLCHFNQWQEIFEEGFHFFPLLGSFVTSHKSKSATLFAQDDQNLWEAKYIQKENRENVLFILRILSSRIVGVSFLVRAAVLLGHHPQYRPIQMFYRKELFSSANPLRRLWLELRRFYILSVPLRCLRSLPNRYTGGSWGEVNRRDKDSEAQSLFAWCLFE